MDDIEYLEEYEDLIMPTMKSDDKDVTDDDDSSSIDQDIFESLFDDQSDDDTEVISKKVDRKLTQRRIERESLDSLDMLVRDLGERVPAKNTTQNESLPSSSMNSSQSKPFTSCLKKNNNTHKNPDEGTPSQEKPQKRVMFAKLPIINRSSSPSSSSSRAPSSSNTSQYSINARKPIDTARSNKVATKSSSSMNSQRKLNRPQPTIVRPEKIQSKDPVDDPLSLENADSDLESLSDISDDSFASLSDILVLPNESNLKATDDKMQSTEQILEAITADLTSELNTSSHISTEGLPEKVTIISDTILSRIDTAILESLATNDSKEAFSKDSKRNDTSSIENSDMSLETNKIDEELPLGNELTVSENLDNGTIQPIEKCNEEIVTAEERQSQILKSSKELLDNSNSVNSNDDYNGTKGSLDEKDTSQSKAADSQIKKDNLFELDSACDKEKQKAELSTGNSEEKSDEFTSESLKAGAQVSKDEITAKTGKEKSEESNFLEDINEVQSQTEKKIEEDSTKDITATTKSSHIENEKHGIEQLTNDNVELFEENIISQFGDEISNEQVLKSSANKTADNIQIAKSPELSISDLRKILGTSADDESKTVPKDEKINTKEHTVDKNQNGPSTSETSEKNIALGKIESSKKVKIIKKVIQKDKNKKKVIKRIIRALDSPTKQELISNKTESQSKTPAAEKISDKGKQLNTSKSGTQVELKKTIPSEAANECKKNVSLGREEKVGENKEKKSEIKTSKDSNVPIEKELQTSSSNKASFKKPVQKDSPDIKKFDREKEINKNIDIKKVSEKSRSASSSPARTITSPASRVTTISKDQKQQQRDSTPKPNDNNKKVEPSQKNRNETPQKPSKKKESISTQITLSSSRENLNIDRNQTTQKKINLASNSTTTQQEKKEATSIKQGDNFAKTQDSPKLSQKQESIKSVVRTESAEKSKNRKEANTSAQNISRNSKVVKNKNEESNIVAARSIETANTSTNFKEDAKQPVKNTSSITPKSGPQSDGKNKLIKRNSLPNMKIPQKSPVIKSEAMQSKISTPSSDSVTMKVSKTGNVETKRKVPDGNKGKTFEISKTKETNNDVKRKVSVEENMPKSVDDLETKGAKVEVSKKENKVKTAEITQPKNAKDEMKTKVSQGEKHDPKNTVSDKGKATDDVSFKDTEVDPKRKVSNVESKVELNKETKNEINKKVSNVENKQKTVAHSEKKDTKIQVKKKVTEGNKEKSIDNISTKHTKLEDKRKFSNLENKERTAEESQKDTKDVIKRKVSHENKKVEVKTNVSDEGNKRKSAEEILVKRKVSHEESKEKNCESTSIADSKEKATLKTQKDNNKTNVNIKTSNKQVESYATSTNQEDKATPTKSNEGLKLSRVDENRSIKQKIFRNKSNDSLSDKNSSNYQITNPTNSNTKDTQSNKASEKKDEKKRVDDTMVSKKDTSSSANPSLQKKVTSTLATVTKETVSQQTEKGNVGVNTSFKKLNDSTHKIDEQPSGPIETKIQASKELLALVGDDAKHKIAVNAPRRLRKRAAEIPTESTTASIVNKVDFQSSALTSNVTAVKQISKSPIVDPVVAKKPRLEYTRKYGRYRDNEGSEAIKNSTATEADKTKKIDLKDNKKSSLETSGSEKLSDFNTNVESKVESEEAKKVSTKPILSETEKQSTSSCVVLSDISTDNAKVLQVDLNKNQQNSLETTKNIDVVSEMSKNTESTKSLEQLEENTNPENNPKVQIDKSETTTSCLNKEKSTTEDTNPKRFKPSHTKATTSGVMTFNEWLARKNSSPTQSDQSIDIKECALHTEEETKDNSSKKISKTIRKPTQKRSEIDILKDSMSREMREGGFEFLMQSAANSPHCVTKRSLAAAMAPNTTETQTRSSSSLSVRLRREKLNDSPIPATQTKTHSMTPKSNLSPVPSDLAKSSSSNNNNRRKTKNTYKSLKTEQKSVLPSKCRKLRVLLNRSIVKLYLKQLEEQDSKSPVSAEIANQQIVEENELNMETYDETKGKKRKAQPVAEISNKKSVTTTVKTLHPISSTTLTTTATTTTSQTLSRANRSNLGAQHRRAKLPTSANTTPPSPTKSLVNASNKSLETIESNLSTSNSCAIPAAITASTTTLRIKPKCASAPVVNETPSLTTAVNASALNSAKVSNKSTVIPTVPIPASGVTPIIENIAPKTEYDDDDNEYMHAPQLETKNTENATDCISSTTSLSSPSPLLTSIEMRAPQAHTSMATTSSAVPLVISGATSHSLPPMVIDNAGTRLYSFLHPTKYNKSHGCVMLDYCCPNLDGPMTAIDPTRRHAKVDAAVRELPAYITMETRLVTRAELEADSNALPASIRHKVQRITGSKIPANSNVSTGTTAAKHASSRAATTTKVTDSTSTVTTSKINDLSLHTPAESAPSILNALQKQLPATTTLTAKSAPATSLNTATGTTTTVPTATITPKSIAEMRARLRANLKKYDILMKRHYPRISLLTFTERQTVIESLAGATQLLPRDVEAATRLLQEYVTHMTLTSASHSKQPTKPTPPTGVLSIATTSGTATLPTTVATTLQKPAVNTRAHSKRNTSATNNNLQRRTVPIYSSDKTVIGYQVQVVTSTGNSSNTGASKAAAVPSFSTQNNSSTKAIVTPPAGNTRRSGIFVINKASTPTTSSDPRTPTNAYQQPSRLIYSRHEVHTSTPISSIAPPPPPILTPIAPAGTVVTRSGSNTARIGRNVTISKTSKRTVQGKIESVSGMVTPVTITTTSSSSALPRLPTLTRNPHLPPLGGARTGSGGGAANESPKRLTRKTAAATGVNFLTRSSNSTELIVVNHDMQGNPLPITDESILPDEGITETAAPIKSEKMDDY